jgi:hypothetical protein
MRQRGRSARRADVSELLLLQRILARLVPDERVHSTIDRLVTDCVVAYFRARPSGSPTRRADQLTGLLHHQACP